MDVNFGCVKSLGNGNLWRQNEETFKGFRNGEMLNARLCDG